MFFGVSEIAVMNRAIAISRLRAMVVQGSSGSLLRGSSCWISLSVFQPSLMAA